MKNKLLSYLCIVMMSVTVVTFITPPMAVHAVTQDEQSEYNRYMQSLLAQGYSMDDIDRFVINNTDGTIRNGLPLLKQAVENGTLKPSGASANAAPQAEDTPKQETPKEEKPAPEHKHEYTASLTTNPTCTEEGVMTYTCSCGDSYTEAYPKLEHQYESAVTKEPNCAVEGEMTYTCTLCGDSYTEPIEVIAHTPGAAQTTVEPTCTKEGEKVVKCTVCGAVISTESIPMTEHEEGLTKITVPERLLKEGVKETHCRNCDILLRSESAPAILGWHHFIPLCVVAAILLYMVIYVAVSFHKDKKKKKEHE